MLRQSVALLLIGSYVACSTFQSFEALEGPEVNTLPVTTEKIRILPVEFKNSANMDKINFISDGQHTQLLGVTRDRPQAVPGQSGKSEVESDSGDRNHNSQSNGEDSKEENPDLAEMNARPKTSLGGKMFSPSGPDSGEMISSEDEDGSSSSTSSPVAIIDSDSVPSMDGGEILREVMVTNMVQTNRFEILTPASFSTSGPAGIPQEEELRQKQVDYLLFAEITDFEVRQDLDYWKVPLWALLLIAAFVVQDDDTRAFILHTLLRLAIYLPSDSKFWELGLGSEDLELRISASVNLRLVDPYTGTVVYADQQSLDRIETVSNMDLIVWRSENSLQIKESTAGRQLRFLTANMVNELVRRMTPASALPEASKEESEKP